MCLGRFIRAVLCGEVELDAVFDRANFMNHRHAVFERTLEFDLFPVLILRDQFGLMTDDRLPPFAVRGPGTAVRFQIPDLHLLAGQNLPGDGEDVLFPLDRIRRFRM